MNINLTPLNTETEIQYTIYIIHGIYIYSHCVYGRLLRKYLGSHRDIVQPCPGARFRERRVRDIVGRVKKVLRR